MVASKKTEILGTKSLSQCDSIRLYNTETFKNASIVSGFGLSEAEVEKLLSTPDATRIVEINTILSRFTEFDTLTPDDSKTFTFNNDVPGLLNGQGFDTIIFLFMGEILGYIQLLRPVGRVTNQSGSSSYDLKRTYLVNTIYLTLTSDGNGIQVNKDTISLLNDLVPIAETTGRDLRGEENYNFATVKDIEGSVDRSSNYTIHLEEALSGREIFTDTTISSINGEGLPVMYKMGIKRNLVLDKAYSSFEHHQVGYYKGDPSLYIWDDQGRYSIFSLTKLLGEFFDDDNIRPLSYTINDEISNSEIFQVPYLFEGQSRPTIHAFAGKYMICKLSGKQYLLDIDRQSGEYNLERPLYEKNRGWIKWTDNETGIQYPVTDFLVDRADPYCKVTLPEGGSWGWTYWTDVVEDIKSLSDTYSDSSVGVVGYNKSLTGKIGQWHITEDLITKTYSALTRSVVMAIEENEPFILNDKALITWSEGTDTEGRETITYTLYNNDGYYMTQKCYDNGSSLSDGESFGSKYIVYPSNTTKRVTFRVSSTNEASASSPLEIQRSFFGGYRRSSLPITMEGFRIIGALGGLIFYRIGNTINYL